MKKERLQKYLARAGVASRRRAEAMILEGRVSLNGSVVKELGSCVENESDVVALDGKRVEVEPLHFYLFHKPRGVISTMDDPHGRRCLQDFAKKLPVRVFSVGRLDVDVSGLVLLTNDGAFAEKLLHPRFGMERVYLALVNGKPSERSLRQLEKGVELEDGRGKALRVKAARADQESERLVGPTDDTCCLLEIVVAEGRKHFVKRLLEAVGHPVKKLSRVSFGPFTLDGLKVGKIKEINDYKAATPAKP